MSFEDLMSCTKERLLSYKQEVEQAYSLAIKKELYTNEYHNSVYYSSQLDLIKHVLDIKHIQFPSTGESPVLMSSSETEVLSHDYKLGQEGDDVL